MTNTEIDAQVAVAVMGHSPNFKYPYSTSANSDILVLEKVRDTWDGSALQLFVGSLFSLWGERTKDPQLLFLQYKIGDYSVSALRALYLVKSE